MNKPSNFCMNGVRKSAKKTLRPFAVRKTFPAKVAIRNSGLAPISSASVEGNALPYPASKTMRTQKSRSPAQGKRLQPDESRTFVAFLRNQASTFHGYCQASIGRKTASLFTSHSPIAIRGQSPKLNCSLKRWPLCKVLGERDSCAEYGSSNFRQERLRMKRHNAYKPSNPARKALAASTCPIGTSLDGVSHHRLIKSARTSLSGGEAIPAMSIPVLSIFGPAIQHEHLTICRCIQPRITNRLLSRLDAGGDTSSAKKSLRLSRSKMSASSLDVNSSGGTDCIVVSGTCDALPSLQKASGSVGSCLKTQPFVLPVGSGTVSSLSNS